MEYLAHVAVMCAIYAILAISLDLAVSHAGLVSLAHAAFAALGAYSTTLFDRYTPLSVAVTAGLVVSFALGYVVGRLTATLQRDVVAMVTFAFASFVTAVIRNAVSLTGGTRGIAGIEPLTFFALQFDTPTKFVPAAVVFLLAVSFVYFRVVRSPFARALRAARDDEILAQSVGYDPVTLRAAAIAMSAAGAALAGFLLARYIQFIHPDTFLVGESILVLTMIIIGGLGRLRGALAGAVLLVILPEALRFSGIPSTYAANARQIAYGLTLVAFVLWRPHGISGVLRNA